MQDAMATQEDIARIIRSIKIRDERIVLAEQELRKVTEEYRKLREELLPVFRMAKDKSQPLPFHPTGAGIDGHNHDQVGVGSLSQLPQPEKNSAGLSRKFSHKGLMLGSTPKNASPTHIPPLIHEGKLYGEMTGIDPSAAVLATSSHLTSSMNGGGERAGGSQPSTSPGQANMPSPTSPPTFKDSVGQSPIIPRSNNHQLQPPPSSSRPTFAQPNDDGMLPAGSYSHGPTSHNPGSIPHLPRSRGEGGPAAVAAAAGGGGGPIAAFSSSTSALVGGGGDTNSISGGGGGSGATGSSSSAGGNSAPSVEIFKSFRVSMEDPCYKVLPAALKEYKINADWKQYALYIVYGDEERCLELDEKPLIVFKQLYREGRKPMFMLRKIASSGDGVGGGAVGSSAGLGGGGGGFIVGGGGGGGGGSGGAGGGAGGQPGSAGLSTSSQSGNHPGGAIGSSGGVGPGSGGGVTGGGGPGSGGGSGGGGGGVGSSGGSVRGMPYSTGLILPGGVL